MWEARRAGRWPSRPLLFCAPQSGAGGLVVIWRGAGAGAQVDWHVGVSGADDAFVFYLGTVAGVVECNVREVDEAVYVYCWISCVEGTCAWRGSINGYKSEY